MIVSVITALLLLLLLSVEPSSSQQDGAVRFYTRAFIPLNVTYRHDHYHRAFEDLESDEANNLREAIMPEFNHVLMDVVNLKDAKIVQLRLVDRCTVVELKIDFDLLAVPKNIADLQRIQQTMLTAVETAIEDGKLGSLDVMSDKAIVLLKPIIGPKDESFKDESFKDETSKDETSKDETSKDETSHEEGSDAEAEETPETNESQGRNETADGERSFWEGVAEKLKEKAEHTGMPVWGVAVIALVVLTIVMIMLAVCKKAFVWKQENKRRTITVKPLGDS